VAMMLMWSVSAHSVDVGTNKDSFIFISGERCPPENCNLRNTNYGKERSLLVSSKGDTTAGIIGFPLDTIKFPYSISKVELHFSTESGLPKINVSDSGCSVSVMMFRNGDWNEESVNANNIPHVDTTSTMHTYIDFNGGNVPLTITPWVTSAMRSKANELGLLVSAIGCNVALPSRESGNGAFIRVTTR